MCRQNLEFGGFFLFFFLPPNLFRVWGQKVWEEPNPWGSNLWTGNLWAVPTEDYGGGCRTRLKG